jgi:hypothetical protein
MADFQAKICEKFNKKSLTNNQSKSITAIIDNPAGGSARELRKSV